tara:strand:- start:1281 stop:1895 length:615 start_codon:yes stop_codon:yes gene_type:complete
MIAKQYKDISGQRFGRLVAKEYIGKNKHRFALWSCACDCGEMMVTTGYSLRKGGTRSCGCLKSEIDSVKAQQMIKTNTGKRFTEPGETAFKNVYSQYKARARRKNMAFDIDRDTFKKLVAESCYVCGCSPSNLMKNGIFNGSYSYNSLDRLDNSKGYILGNVAPCCKVCNEFKSDLDLEDFVSFLKIAYKKLFIDKTYEERFKR